MPTPYHDAATAHRAQFASDGLETASNARILTLCFDRLDRDLLQARAAMERQDHYATNDALGHAQDLVSELADMLDVGAWQHAGSLLALYDYLLRLLQTANVHKADGLVAEAQRLISEIGDAFRAAAQVAAAPAVLPKAAARPGEPEPDPSPRWSVSA
jgi:flagellar protein FliS